MTTPRSGVTRALAFGLAGAAAVLAGCAAPPAPVGVLDLYARPAERALLDGLKAYDDAQYDLAAQRFRDALSGGLATARDRAEAHKRLAFIDCAAGRLDPCEAEFRAARAADAGFALSRAEAGHPVWGPVYRRLPPP